ncbi:MAG: PQQ-dependent sugar dehydrogenase [Fimbriimonadales bacterium]
MLKHVSALLFGAASIASCSYLSRSASETEPANGSGSKLDRPAAPLEAQSTNVTELWIRNCSNCHGREGEGGGAGTKTLITQDLYDQKHDRPFFDTIKNGKPDMGMEAFGKTLKDQEIWALVVHIREMQSRGLRAKFGSPKAVDGVYTSKLHKFRMETVVEGGLSTPWSLNWLPDGRMLVTNLSGALNVVEGGKLSPAVQGTPAVAQIGQGGLMDVAVHPDYAKNGWIYFSFADPAKNGNGGFTKIVRGKLQFSGGRPAWTNQETIFEVAQENYNGSGVHFGSRIVFDGKGHIFFSIGERGNGNLAQDLTKPNGKIYRVNEDGTIPGDNPFASAADKAKGRIGAIWSYGHRNPQGLVMGLDGTLWDTEHAPRGGDEVNRIQKGANYGWPIISFGINYNDSPYSTPWPGQGQDFQLPIFRWLPSTGACGLDVMRGKAFPSWNGDLIAGGLSGANVDRIRTQNGKFVEREELLQGIGRVRDVAVGPDGYLYIAINQPDKVVRLVPAN